MKRPIGNGWNNLHYQFLNIAELMAKNYKIYIWKTAPFVRLLIPLIAGILIQYYFVLPPAKIIIPGITLIVLLVIFRFLPLIYRFRFSGVPGIFIALIMLFLGMFLTRQKDIRSEITWYGNFHDSSSYILATLSEPPIEKAKSYKVLATVESIIKKDSAYRTKGSILLYFAKDSGDDVPKYGDRIIISKQPQEIKNSGNPGAFNYARYSAFQQLFQQLYLKKSDWVLIGHTIPNDYNSYIFDARQKILDILDKYVPGNDEKAIAIALLIGYKIDLDKDLVQAYSNAGVVHLIAISGMHMAIIYSVLVWIFSKVPLVRNSKVTQLALILFCLWFFALLTGASGSVLRSAVMFSFIAIGLAVNKKTTIYNSMATSAFVLLCYNPYLLWDVGFQLSYFAVLGIVISQRYIANWFYLKNKILNSVWQLTSVSLAAQLFTFPICIYYFHQLPLLFLVSNLIAIPLSTIALWACIILVIISPLQLFAIFCGKIIFVVIWLINHTVLFINSIPFSLWDNISLTVANTIVLYLVVCSFLYWLIKKEKVAFKFALLSLLLFSFMLSANFLQAWGQKKIIVYNVPNHKAIDFVSANKYQFLGDSDLENEGVLKNFHLKPGRISLMAYNKVDTIDALYKLNSFYQFHKKRFLLLDSAITYEPVSKKIDLDYIIISKNPKLFIPKLANVFNAGMYIFDASNPMWKIQKWKKDCEDLHLRFYSVPEQGAFITDL